MKKLFIALTIICIGFVSAEVFISKAEANDIEVYYSPSCPHCHHALDFISDDLMVQYPNISVSEINVMENNDNLSRFKDAVKKCDFKTGAIPLIVIENKCWQGYSDTVKKEIENTIKVKNSNN